MTSVRKKRVCWILDLYGLCVALMLVLNLVVRVLARRRHLNDAAQRRRREVSP